jgi:hypothetical protein
MNSRQLCYILIYHVCFLSEVRRITNPLDQGRSGYLRLAVGALSGELTFGVIATCPIGTSFVLSYKESFSRAELFLEYSRNLVWRKPKFIHS